jgi:predicted ATP-grasp superfamily ATP-dependent carboligase
MAPGGGQWRMGYDAIWVEGYGWDSTNSLAQRDSQNPVDSSTEA